MTWHVTVRGATEAELATRNILRANAVDGATVVGTDAIPVLAICDEYGTCVWTVEQNTVQGRHLALLAESLVDAAMKVIA